jgi:MGT family glycosyltransferase
MATTAFFSIPLYSHIKVSLSIVEELVRRGERVFYYATEEFRPQIERTGAIFCRYEGIDDGLNNHLGEYNHPIKLACALVNLTPDLVETCLPLIQRQKPDYIMHDTVALWGALIAQALKIPTVASQATFLITAGVLQKSPTLLAKQIEYLTSAGAELQETNEKLARATEALQLPPITVPESFFIFGDRTFVYTSRQFQPEEQDFDQHFHFIGPNIDPHDEHVDFPFARLQDKQVIYISLGTIFNNQLNFFRTCLQAFADTAYQVVISLGKKVDPTALGAIPDNFIVRSHVPQIQVLSQSALFITHGGLNSVVEAMHQGVPMLVALTDSGDQPHIAYRVEELGAGQVVDLQNISAQNLRETAIRILSQPSFAQVSATIGKSLQTAGGSTHAVDEIERLKKEKGIGVTEKA